MSYDNSSAPYGYDPMTGQPRSAPQGQSAAPYGYDPVTGQPRSVSDNNSSAGIRRGSSSGKGSSRGGKKRGGSIAALIAVLAAVIVVAAVVVFFVIRPFGNDSDTSDETAALNNTFEALLDSNEVTGYVQDLADSGSAVGIRVQADDLSSLLTSYGGLDEDMAALLDLSVSGGVVISKDTAEASADLSVSVAGSAYTMELYASDKTIVLSIPELLPDSYCLDLTSLSSDLENSIFYPGSGSDYALDSYSYAELQSAITELESALAALDAQAAAQTDPAGDYMDALEEAGLTPQFEVEKDTVTVGDSEVSCKVHSVTLSSTELYEIMTFTQTYLESQLSETATALLSEMGFSPDDIGLLAQEALASDLYLSVEYDIYKDYVIRLDVSAFSLEEDRSFRAVFDFGQNPADTDEVTLTLLQDGSVLSEFALLMEDEDDEYSLSLFLFEGESHADSLSTPLVTFSLAHDSGAFSLNVPTEGYALSGYAAVEDSSLTISGLRLTETYDGSALDLSDFTFEINSAAELAEPDPDAVDVLSLTDGDIASLYTVLISQAGSLYSALYY